MHCKQNVSPFVVVVVVVIDDDDDDDYVELWPMYNPLIAFQNFVKIIPLTEKCSFK